MIEDERDREVRRWLRYACEDIAAAEALLVGADIAPREPCWLAQQAGEKAIKAVLIFQGTHFPRTHDLDVLRNLLEPRWALRQDPLDLAGLTEWAVEARYPGDWPDPDEDDAQLAMQTARAVMVSLTADLVRAGFDTEPPDDTGSESQPPSP